MPFSCRRTHVFDEKRRWANDACHTHAASPSKNTSRLANFGDKTWLPPGESFRRKPRNKKACPRLREQAF
jgi:hypothetical protein